MNAAIDGVKGAQLPVIRRFTNWWERVLKPRPKTRAIIFAQLFWSNQADDQTARTKPDAKAFLPNNEGRVDMSAYRYREQTGYINFDYGFWDEATHSFWHANHSQPGMEVYQSTREKFAAGYVDFDRIVYCVAVAHNYDPKKAAAAEALKKPGKKP